MAELGADLWKYNLARVCVIDVTEDYRAMRPHLPSECYEVLKEFWMPVYQLVPLHGGSATWTASARLWLDALPPDGYLYDWHEPPEGGHGTWYVGVVSRELLA